MKKQRLGALVLGVVALAVVVTAVFAYKNADRWGAFGGAGASQPMELRGAWLGMRLTDTDTATARQFGIPETVKGVVVAEVSPGADSRAAAAQIQPGDVVVQVDGTEIVELSQLHDLSGKLDVARPVPVQILRQGQPFNVVLPPPSGAVSQVSPGLPGGAATPVGFQRPGVAYGPNGCVVGPGGVPTGNCPPGWGWR